MTTVRIATTTSGTLSSSFENGDTIDSITLATGDHILIKDQSTATENGVYSVNASGAPTRVLNFRVGVGISESIIYVIEGTLNGFTQWTCTNASGSDVVGTDNLTFTNTSIRNPVDKTSTQTISASKTFSTAITNTPSTNQLVLSGPTRTATISAIEPATSSRTYTIPDAGANDSFTMLAATQTLTNKTLTATTNACRGTEIGTSGSNVVISSTAPTLSQVLTATSGTAANWQTPAGGTITTFIATATTTSSVSPSTYTLINSMTLTPGAGTYYCSFSTSASITNKSTTYDYAIFNNGTIVQQSERTLSIGTNGDTLACHSQIITTVSASQAIDVRLVATTGSATVDIFERSLILIKTA